MQKQKANRDLTVCLLSQHQLVLREFRDRLSGAGIHLRTLQLEPALSSELRHLSLPRMRIYVVDAHAPHLATEALVAGILERHPNARVLVMAESIQETNAFPLLQLGAKGLLSYAEAREQMSRAIKHVAEGGFWVPRHLLARFVDWILSGYPNRRSAQGATQLSRREQEVLDGLLGNLSNKEIADRLHISERTAKFHVSNLLKKYGVRRRSDLILLHFQTQTSR